MRKRLLNSIKLNLIVPTLMILTLIFGLSLPAYAAEGGSCGSDLKWELSDGTLVISGKGEMTDYQDGSMAPWYEKAEEITAVSLPSGLTSIGDFAFYGCTNLTNVSISQKVTSIGDYSFADCTKLLQINLGNVQTIGDGAFYQCEALGSISFPTTVTTIGTRAFYRCYGLQTVTIPSSVTSMGASVFGYCEGLVRAIVNAPLDTLPVWTFYGCSNLTDVSLAPQITSVGEYAFQHCENLEGVYVQSGDEDTATKIDQSIIQGHRNETISSDSQSEEELPADAELQPEMESAGVVDPFVATHGMPNSSTVIIDGEEAYTTITVVQNGNVSVSLEEVSVYSEESKKLERMVKAAVADSDDWTSVAEVLEEELKNAASGNLVVELQLSGTKISAEDLAKFAGKSLTLNLKLANGIIWKLDMSKLLEEQLSGSYELGVELTKIEAEKTTIGSDNVYHMKFAGNVDFNATVGVPLGLQYDYATLFVKEKSSYELINTMIVDQDSYAWFSLAGVNKHTKYYIGMNVEKITAQDATIPETMYAEYGLEEDGAYLMDEDGIQYRITGRSSRWGITGKQFAIYVGVAIGATVLIVGSVMLALNIIKKSREKYERMAEEEALKEKEAEEALRMEIMRELLGESDDSIKNQ